MLSTRVTGEILSQLLEVTEKTIVDKLTDIKNGGSRPYDVE